MVEEELSEMGLKVSTPDMGGCGLYYTWIDGGGVRAPMNSCLARFTGCN